MGEFELIRRFFVRPERALAAPVLLGPGDDCALLAPTPGMALAVSSDALVEGRHFLSTVAPERLGHKALAVNLSDLAACGARPLGFTLALALPQVQGAWLERFAAGLFALADAHGCPLIGGDTTRGPLTITITVLGEVPPAQALRRSGACVGDDVYVSGTLGDARLALELMRGTLSLPQALFEAARARMELPTPRLALGQALRGVATSAIDVSDGLAGDLGHVLAASGVGAGLDGAVLAQLVAARAHADCPPGLFSEAQWQQWALSGGDDYELAFTAPAQARARVAEAARQAQTPITRLGVVEAAPGLRVYGEQGQPLALALAGFDHFANEA